MREMTTTMATPVTVEDLTPIDFCTLGMFIIDEIHPSPRSPSQEIQHDILGGAGTYSAVGARLFSPGPQLSRRVAWIVDAGPDFPSSARETITSWQTSALIRPRDAPTTRGWNGYSGNEHRAFRYLTAKKRVTAADLTAPMLGSRSFHLICGADRCVDLVGGIDARRREEEGVGEEGKGKGEGGGKRGMVIWEPVPDLCVPEEREGTFAALRCVDFVSPNHAELAALFGTAHEGERVERGLVEEQAWRLVERGIGREGDGAVVVRAGAEGCFVRTRTLERWLPAVHRDGDRVVDPTGGGNGFLGGFAVGWVRSGGDVVEAARWGSVAASFTIEQVGMPMLDKELDTAGRETWNGSSVLDRLDEFRMKTT